MPVEIVGQRAETMRAVDVVGPVGCPVADAWHQVLGEAVDEVASSSQRLARCVGR
jgi:hypothetical protein